MFVTYHIAEMKETDGLGVADISLLIKCGMKDIFKAKDL